MKYDRSSVLHDVLVSLCRSVYVLRDCFIPLLGIAWLHGAAPTAIDALLLTLMDNAQ